MCTVTIIPKGENDFVLTTNRDEAPSRKSLAPDFYQYKETKLLYPKDELSGGTWIGICEKNRLVCVLNGGFEFHERKAKYRMSRGIVSKDFLNAHDIVETINNYNLDNIEPFTIIVVDWNSVLKLYELVWDGKQKHFIELPFEPKIWSSSTLYNKTMRNDRLIWFENYQKENEVNADTVLKFHNTAGESNIDYGVIMDRGFVRTTSITQVKKVNDEVSMYYESLQNKSIVNKTFSLPQIVNE